MPSGRESCALSPDPGGCPRQCRWELGSPRAHGRIRGSSPGGACGRPLELHQTLKDSLGVRRLLSEETGPRSHSLWPSSCPAPKVVPTPLFGPGPRLLPTFSPSSLPARSPAAVTHTLMSLFACLLPTECEPHQVRGPSLHRGRGPRAGSPARDTATEAGVSVRTGWARLRDKHAPAPLSSGLRRGRFCFRFEPRCLLLCGVGGKGLHGSVHLTQAPCPSPSDQDAWQEGGRRLVQEGAQHSSGSPG